MKVYIWGTGRLAEACVADLLPYIQVAGIVETSPQKSEFCGYEVISGREFADKGYDYVILANSHEEDIVRDFALPGEKTVYYRMSVRWDSTHKVRFERKNASDLKDILFQSQQRLDVTEAARGIMPYVSVESDGLRFLFDRDDNLIANDMLGSGKTYSRNEMEFFYKMAPKYRKGYFLDIGANIGTTSIYFRKNICNTLKYIAFEPLKDNAKVLKANCILNDCDDIKVVHAGLSNVIEKKRMHIFNGAFGSSMISDNSDAGTVCDFMTLDGYIRENNLSPKEIAYIWADVQCHELEVVEGGLDTMRESPASLYIEFNIEAYKKETGKAERFLSLLASIYRSFICYEQYETGRTGIRGIDEVMQLLDEIEIPFCNILFMK